LTGQILTGLPENCQVNKERRITIQKYLIQGIREKSPHLKKIKQGGKEVMYVRGSLNDHYG
jgi:hypothetical protein